LRVRLLLPRSVIGIVWILTRKFQTAHPAQQVQFILAELILVFIRIERLITLLRAHLAQVAEGVYQRSPTILWQIAEVTKQLARFTLLTRRKMLQRFHPPQDAPLLVRREVPEGLQTIPEALLIFRLQLLKVGIFLKGPLLVLQAHAGMAAKPVPAMRTGAIENEAPLLLLIRRPILLRRLRWIRMRLRPALRPASRGAHRNQRNRNYRAYPPHDNTT